MSLSPPAGQVKGMGLVSLWARLDPKKLVPHTEASAQVWSVQHEHFMQQMPLTSFVGSMQQPWFKYCAA